MCLTAEGKVCTAVIPAEETSSSPLEMKPARNGQNLMDRTCRVSSRNGQTQMDSLREKKQLTSMQCKEAGTDQFM